MGFILLIGYETVAIVSVKTGPQDPLGQRPFGRSYARGPFRGMPRESFSTLSPSQLSPSLHSPPRVSHAQLHTVHPQ